MMPERWQLELRKLKTLEPPAGLWEQAVQGPRRKPPRGEWAPRFAAALVALAVVGASTYGLVRAFGPTAGHVVAGSQASRYVDPRFGWEIRYPRGMVAGHFESEGLFTSDGARLTNFPPDLRAPSTGTPAMGWLRSFPADGVALQIWFGERLPGVPPLRDSEFPLLPTSFDPTRPYVGGAEPPPLYRVFFADGFSFSAAVWIGPQASLADRQSIWDVVRSLSLPSLAEGTIWQERYYVLGPASRFPIGSVTAFSASSLPRDESSFSKPEGFYLVNAPRAFYVVKQVFQNPVSPSTMCTVAFDHGASQFFCPGTDLRWDRVGQPLGVHAGDGPDWALPLHVATVAQDGHILFSPFFGGLLPIDLKGDPWG
jgi:hypothetical protein